jgi:hypothetical protein
MSDFSDNDAVDNIEWFFNKIEPVKAAYPNPECGYVLQLENRGARLVGAQLIFNPAQPNLPEYDISAGKYYAFRGKLEALQTNPRDLIQQLLEGEVPAPNGRKFHFDREGRTISPTLARSQGALEGFDRQQLIYALTGYLTAPYGNDIFGGELEDHWTLRSANPPFANLQDLLAHVALRPTGGLSVIALPPVLIDGTSSIRGEVGQFKLRLAGNLPTKSASLGVLIHIGGVVKTRLRLHGPNFEWSTAPEGNGVLVGTTELKVPKTSIAHCFACYGDQCYHDYWIGDVHASQNPFRTIYETFDGQLEKLTELLNQPSKRGVSRDFESAVASLLWILGFAPLHLAALSDAPDIIAVSADGNIAVVECTLSSLKADNKIQKLVDRTNEIRKSLERADLKGKICIPIMITSRLRADIEVDIEECTRRGVVVFTQDDMTPGFPSTITVPNSAARFEELKKRLQSAQKQPTEAPLDH